MGGGGRKHFETQIEFYKQRGRIQHMEGLEMKSDRLPQSTELRKHQ